ncbi:MAG: hypothetical protein RSE41_03150 [Clostridia bacterium]
MNIFKYINNKIDDYYRRKMTIIEEGDIIHFDVTNLYSNKRIERIINEYFDKLNKQENIK